MAPPPEQPPMMRSSPWLALVALVLCAPGAEAQRYQRTLVPGRPYCVLWPGRDFVYRFDAAGSRRTPGDSEFASLEAAFSSWRAVSATCSDFTFTRGPDIQNPRVGYVRDSQDPNANENVITFREVDCNDIVPPEDPCLESDTCSNVYACWDHGAAVIGLTTTTFSYRTAYILDADVEFNASVNGRGFLFTTVDSPMCEGAQSTDCVVTDVQNTATHEFGHVVGLDHVSELGSTMEPTAPPGETHKRIIDAGSAAGFCQAYPRGLPPTQCVGPEPGRHFQAISQGPGIGCGAAPEALFPTAALLGLLSLGRRRKRPARRDGADS
ncbi:MAG TPA: myxosortase-dependent metalloprotease, MXAN_2677/MXAN_2678 family [Archangium sp.]|uniref:myxosortase-dependent metalloprotease, MXAN_2677/MXAN_2678 family n=1 Tax=Archangium sp. TaxID=1872627 RepID=UPI002E36EFE2|nr:myxosortase-dependent metalloprotease, MXAN_2677/MXAN_2678 family [Archangium sp.]HEX5752057.1 myxosortase-dependent metalloprotease, MXAN_2677/MXAN_2678 family [Archangium sp.]